MREDLEAFILDELHDLNYVYKYREQEVSASCLCSQMLNLMPIKTERGAFCSVLVLQVYSKHHQKLSSATNLYYDDYQIGAVALAAAAICQPVHCS